jgi:hypothetical protein
MAKLIFYKGQIPEWLALSKARQRELAPSISKLIIRRPVVFILPVFQMIFAVWLIGFSPHFQLKDLLFLPMIIGSAAIAFLPYHAHFRNELLAVLAAEKSVDH